MGQQYRLGIASQVDLLLWIIERKGGHVVAQYLTCFPINFASRFERLKKIFADTRVLGALAGKDEQNGGARISQLEYGQCVDR